MSNATADKPRLGTTDEQLTLETSDENRLVAISLVEQADRTLDIVSRNLDPPVFDTAEFVESVRALALRSRHSQIRIVVLEPQSVVTAGHQLLQIASRLSTFIEIRRPGANHAEFNQAMLIVDQTGIVHRHLSDRYDGIANFNDRQLAGELSRKFDDIWEHAISDPNFRRMSL